MRKAYIFDFDGTICDSSAASVEVLRALAPLFGFRRFDDSEIPALRRLSMDGVLKSLEVKRWTIPLLAWCARRQMRRHMAALQACAGMKEVLAALREQGVTTAIVTSNSYGNVRRFLDKEGIAVDRICAGSSLAGKAPLLRKLIGRLGIAPAEALYIGDEVRDVEAARAAGIACAVVTWGYNTEEVLFSCNPHYVVRRPRDLLEIP